MLSLLSSFTWPGFMAWQLQREERSKGKVQRQTNVRQGIAANLRRGCHTYLGDKIVIKQTDDVLLLDLLGGGDFWRRRHRRPFPQLHASEHTATAQTATPKKTRDRNQVSHKNWRWGKSQPQAQSRVQSTPSEERLREGEGLNWNKTTTRLQRRFGIISYTSAVGKFPSAEEKRNTINMHWQDMHT